MTTTYPPAASDRMLRATYTKGDCWLLARHLRALTGWPVVLLVADREFLADDAYYWRHAAVRVPGGGVLDIEGVRTDAEWRDRWALDTDDAVVDLTSDAAVDDNLHGGWTVYAHAAGEPERTAAALLAWLPDEYRRLG